MFYQEPGTRYVCARDTKQCPVKLYSYVWYVLMKIRAIRTALCNVLQRCLKIWGRRCSFCVNVHRYTESVLSIRQKGDGGFCVCLLPWFLSSTSLWSAKRKHCNVLLRNVTFVRNRRIECIRLRWWWALPTETHKDRRQGEDNDDRPRGRKASPVHSDTGITEAHQRTARRPLAGR